MLIRAALLLMIVLVAGCETDGRPAVAPSGISANHGPDGMPMGGGADTGFRSRGSTYIISRGAR